MRLPWQKERSAECDTKLAEAEEALEQLVARSERIGPYIEQRKRRNHITEAVEAAIYRKHGRPA